MSRKDPERMSGQIGFGIIGCGGIAQAHLKALEFVPEIRLVATCDIRKERAEDCAAQYGAARAYSDYTELARDPEIQAVSICLPHHLHRDPTVACAREGKHVLCEKPMETTLADADAMIEASDQAGSVLMIGQVLRFRNANIEARRLIQHGAIGRPLNVLRRRLSLSKDYPGAPWSADPALAGGWTLYGFGSHEVDSILWLMDSPARTVYATGRRNNPHWQDYDEITIQMTLDSGAMASQQHSLNCAFGAWECIVIGEENSLKIETDRLLLGDEVIPAPLQDGGGMREQFREFSASILEGREPEASGRNVRRTMVALEAAKMSMDCGQVVDASAL